MTKHRVAVMQAGSSLFDTPKTLARMAAHCEAAQRLGVELAVFPEAYVGGYPKGLDFGARVGSRTGAGRDDFLRYWQSAIDVPGPECAAIGGFAQAMKAHIVTGVIERDGGTLYCTVLFFGPDGSLLGKHRKLMPTASERLVWGQGDGSTLPVIDTAIGKIGAVDLLGELHARAAPGACTPRASICSARRRWTSARSGKPRCATSPMKGAPSCSAPAST